MKMEKFYVKCESKSFSKCYFVDAYSQYEAEKEALHNFKAEFPMLAFYAKVSKM